MKIPDLDVFCVRPSPAAGGLCIRFPGGFTLCLPDPRLGHPLSQVEALLKGFSAALMPLAPFFNLLAVVVAIIDVIKAVPALIGPPPDPAKFIEALNKLIEAAAKLVSLIPQASIPIFVKDLLAVVAFFLRALATELQAFVAQATRIEESATLAADLNLPSLSVEVSCAQDAFDIEMANLNESLGPLAQLLGLVNVLLGLAGLPEIEVDLSTSSSPQEAIDAMLRIAQVLDDVANTIPV